MVIELLLTFLLLVLGVFAQMTDGLFSVVTWFIIAMISYQIQKWRDSMGQCTMCGKKGLFFKVDKNSRCADCAARVVALEAKRAAQMKEQEKAAAEKARIRAEEEKARAEQARRRAAEAQRLAEQARIEELKKPFDAPEYNSGYCLVYSYTDVGFFVPDELKTVSSSVPPYKQLTLSYEEDNPYDASAIAVKYNGAKIGYMYKGKLRDMVSDYDRDDRSVMAVSRYWTDAPILDLFFYRSAIDVIKSMRRNENAHEFTLTNNRGAEAQDDIGFSSVGEPVDLIYDPEIDRYIVECNGFFIGRLPAGANRIIERFSEFDAKISAIEEDDETEKMSVDVVVVPS